MVVDVCLIAMDVVIVVDCLFTVDDVMFGCTVVDID